MRAIVLSEPGPVENLRITDLPVPEPKHGWVRIGARHGLLHRESGDLPAKVLQGYLDKIAAGTFPLGKPTVYDFADIRTAHDDMEHNRVIGKLVVHAP